MIDQQSNRKENQWSVMEELHYNFYMIASSDLLDLNKRKTKFFQKMSKIIPTRTNQQCRCHHVKKIKNLKKIRIKDKTCQQRMLIYKFYYQQCKLRQIKLDHLQEEIISFLKDCLKRSYLAASEYSHYISMLNDNIDRLNLQVNCLMLQSQNEINNEEQQIGSEASQNQQAEKVDMSIQNQILAQKKQQSLSEQEKLQIDPLFQVLDPSCFHNFSYQSPGFDSQEYDILSVPENKQAISIHIKSV